MWSQLKKGLTFKARSQTPAPVIHAADRSLDEDRTSEPVDGGTGQSGAKEIATDTLLAPEEAASLKGFMETLEVEVAIQELLDRNRQALERLEELQLQRLGRENGGAGQVEVGSEEWDIGE